MRSLLLWFVVSRLESGIVKNTPETIQGWKHFSGKKIRHEQKVALHKLAKFQDQTQFHFLYMKIDG